MNLKLSALTTAKFLWLSTFLQAATVFPSGILYDQTHAPINNAWYSDASLRYPQSIGDDFSVNGTWLVERISWLGGYDNNVDISDEFSTSIWSVDSSGIPNSVMLEDVGTIARISTGRQTFWGWDIYEYTWSFPLEFILSDGVYMFEVQNDTSSVPENWGWMTGSGPNFYYYYKDNPGVQWLSSGNGGATQFKVEGQVVPEVETSLLVLFAGLVATAMRSRGSGRTRRRSQHLPRRDFKPQ